MEVLLCKLLPQFFSRKITSINENIFSFFYETMGLLHFLLVFKKVVAYITIEDPVYCSVQVRGTFMENVSLWNILCFLVQEKTIFTTKQKINSPV